MIKQKLKDFWKYLNTSHGTYRGIVSYIDDGYYAREPVYEDVPNKTPLWKLEKIILTSTIVAVLGGICLLGRCCVLEQRKAKERAILPPYALKFFVDMKKDALNKIEKNRKLGITTSFEELNIDSTEGMIEFYRKTIREKIEKGYLKPGERYWDDYKAIFEKEDWWPKDVNNLNNSKNPKH